MASISNPPGGVMSLFDQLSGVLGGISGIFSRQRYRGNLLFFPTLSLTVEAKNRNGGF
jgi:hypothetical protein